MNVSVKTSKIINEKKKYYYGSLDLCFLVDCMIDLKLCPLGDRFQFPLVMLLFSCYEKC